jgi:hypothetical protein
MAYNGRNNMYMWSGRKNDTEIMFSIPSLDRKRKVARIAISGRLLSIPPARSYLDIPPSTLTIQGKFFDYLVAKPKKK